MWNTTEKKSLNGDVFFYMIFFSLSFLSANFEIIWDFESKNDLPTNANQSNQQPSFYCSDGDGYWRNQRFHSV